MRGSWWLGWSWASRCTRHSSSQGFEGSKRAPNQRPGERAPGGGRKGDGAAGAGAKDSAASHYRDRARERREGQLGEYEESAQILSQLAQASEDGEGAISYEQSKYLGGDVEHTHLVKGLDYALLEQIKRQTSAPDDRGDASSGGDDDDDDDDAAAAAADHHEGGDHASQGEGRHGSSLTYAVASAHAGSTCGRPF